MTLETRTEIAELRAQVATFEKAEVERQAGSIKPIDEELQQGSDRVALSVLGRERSSGPWTWTGQVSFTWDQLLSLIGPNMVEAVAETAMRERVETAALSQANGMVHSRMHDVTLTDEAWGTVILQLRALGLIVSVSEYLKPGWKLTPTGDAYVIRQLALRRKD